MFSKLVIVALIAVASAQHQQPAQYPAGVNPALCPGFPICDNALLHSPNAQQQQWGQPAPYTPQYNQYNPAPQQPQYNQYNPQPQYQPQPQSYPALTGPANNHLPGAGGDRYPAGVNPQSCPNYPYCDTGASAYNSAPQVAPLPGFTERLYPAGVSPQQCPNFPYCS